MEVTAHTDTKPDEQAAMDLTNKECNTIKNYFVKKGVVTNRLKMISKGSTQPRKKCPTASDCTEEDHKQNRRIEFVVYKS